MIEMGKSTTQSSESGPSPDMIRAALDAIIASDVFNNSVRLQEFLSYVVEESLAGRGQKIRAKLISEVVYKRPIDTNTDNENVVRVDAGRLRRRLDHYYLDAGNNDPLRIHIDPGGYAPRFEKRSTLERSTAGKWRRRVLAGSFVVGVCVIAGIAYVLGSRQSIVEDAQSSKQDIASQDMRALERRAIFDHSPASLQAVNLAEQARGLIFPIFRVERLKLTTDMFRQAISLDDQYFGGYAGAAQTLGVLALLTPTGPKRENLQSEAQAMAATAMGLDPTHSWSQSAAAWVAFTGKDFDRAMRLSSRSMKLSPDDGNVLDFHALISFFAGDFETARDAADPNRTRGVSKQRFANRNIFAAANFHLGEYSKTIESFKIAADTGDPVGAPTLAFLAATYHAMGNTKLAEQKAGELSTAWPDFRADLVLRRFYRHREHADAVVSRLLAAGWTPSTLSDSDSSSK
jgi:tetratricopeptide (TPR) repeat protein